MGDSANRRQNGASSRDRSRTRAQAFTLEAIAAAIVVLGSLLFALQVSGVTSLTASTSNEQVLEQQSAVAAGVLDSAASDDEIRPTLLYWSELNASFHNTSEVDESFYTRGPPTAFGGLLNQTLDDRSIAYNVDLLYLNETGVITRTRLVRNGNPSDDAARATRTVTLYDDERLLHANETRTNATLSNASFYAPDAYPDDPIYNVVRVEVVVWRT